MNQYSYGQPQPMYNPQTQNAYGFNTPYVSGINWAQGIEGAKAFRMKPNDIVIILDSENEGVMYINAAIMVSKLIEDVSSELKCAEQYLLNKEAIGYNMSDIIIEQDCEKDMYSKKICKLFGKK